jgi:hypothetical protein
VSGFERSWLALREPVDHAARSGALALRFAVAVGGAPRLIDLASGSGSNLRYLSPRLGPDQRWLCIDHDRALLAVAIDAIAAWGEARGLACARSMPSLLELSGAQARLRVALVESDLADVDDAFDLEGIDGVSASAFLDLVSPAWASRLAGRLAATGLPALFALTYDGRLRWQPEEECDPAMVERFNRHQRTDKGFGAALGPAAAPHLAERLEAERCRVELVQSDWRIDAAKEPALLQAFLEGLIAAAREIEDDDALARWAELRRRQALEGRLALRVGHLDLLALPRAVEAPRSGWPT